MRRATTQAREPGLIWKIWTESRSDRLAGGLYLFQDRIAAEAFLDRHAARLAEIGVTGLRSRILDVNEGLSRATRAPEACLA